MFLSLGQPLSPSLAPLPPSLGPSRRAGLLAGRRKGPFVGKCPWQIDATSVAAEHHESRHQQRFDEQQRQASPKLGQEEGHESRRPLSQQLHQGLIADRCLSLVVLLSRLRLSVPSRDLRLCAAAACPLALLVPCCGPLPGSAPLPRRPLAKSVWKQKLDDSQRPTKPIAERRFARPDEKDCHRGQRGWHPHALFAKLDRVPVDPLEQPSDASSRQ